MRRQRTLHRMSLAGLVVLISLSAHSFYVPPEYEQVPLDRLLQNLQAKVRAEPRNVQALVNLGRTHAMAYSSKSTVATVFQGEPQRGWQPESGEAFVPFNQPVPAADASGRKAALEHLQAALGCYERAAALAPDDPIIRLGYAWLTERSGNRRHAIQLYRQLIAREWTKDPASVPKPAPGPDGSGPVFVEIIPDSLEQSVLPEAVRYLIPLLDPRRDGAEIAELTERARIIKSRPRAVSPIAVPLRDGLRAIDLEDRTARVAFDADGSGERKHWTWISDEAAWLVYHRPTSITSALQLFGNFTFWLFWQNGYEAPAALDDDHDGMLRDNELTALALWHDVDGNGLAEAGEVQPLAAYGIIAVSCRYAHDSEHPDHIAYAPMGVVFADGSSRATYDLLLHPR